MIGAIETYFENGLWHNRVAGHGTFPQVFDIKGVAVERGGEIARDRSVEHLVYDVDGSVAERRDYRPDSDRD